MADIWHSSSCFSAVATNSFLVLASRYVAAENMCCGKRKKK
jgi:hypothetical protein